MAKITTTLLLLLMMNSSFSQSYKAQLEKINTYLKTFDNGYYGYLEIKNGYLFDRFPSGKYSKSEIKYLTSAKEVEYKRKVSINCNEGKDCVYSTYTDSYHNSIGFSQSNDFNTTELINLLNNLITAYNKESGKTQDADEEEDMDDAADKTKLESLRTDVSFTKNTIPPAASKNNPTSGKQTPALQKLNDFLKTFDNGYYGYFEVIGDEVYLRFKSGKYNRYNINEIGNAEIQTQYNRVILPCKDNKQCIYTTWKDGYEEYTQFLQNYQTFDFQELKGLLDNFITGIKGDNGTTASSNEVKNTTATDRQRSRPVNEKTEVAIAKNMETGSTPSGDKDYIVSLQKLNEYLKTFNPGTYDKVDVKDNKVIFYFKVYSMVYNSSISITDLLQNTTILNAKAIGEFGSNEIKIFCKNDKKCFYSTYSKGDVDHFRFFSNTVKDLTKMEQLLKEFVKSL